MKWKRGEGLVKQLTLPLKNGASLQGENVGQQRFSTTWALGALGSARWNFRVQYERWPGSSRSCSQRMPGNKKRIFHISKWFPGFGKDRKKKIFSKRIGWCVMFLSSKQKFKKFKSMLNRILIQIGNSKKTCQSLSVAPHFPFLCVGGKMLGCFLFSRFVTQKRWAYISQRCLRRLLRFRCLIFCLKIGQIEFLEADVGCPSSVDKDACAEPLMKSCFRKIFWIPVWYPPNRNEQRWCEFKCFNTIQLYCFLLAFSSCIWF